MSTIAIRAEGLGKEYHLGATTERYKTIRDSASRLAKRITRGRKPAQRDSTSVASKGETLWALRDVDFEIQQGEVVGLIGHNGAGKSTLLKVLSRITEPTRGYADVSGRVGSLLEVGTGFHPELTGRENIILSGAILGMTRREILASFDEIVAFAEVDRFLDTPVKHYSSGMYLRLAFAVAAHLRPEILLVDEVLAVGDAGFQRRCLGKMGTVARDGRTVLFVSHNLAAIENLCPRTMFFRGGRVARFSSSSDVIAGYLADGASELPVAHAVSLLDRSDRQGNGRLRFDFCTLVDRQGAPTQHVRAGDPAVFQIGLAREATLADGVDAAVEIKLYDQSGAPITTLSTYLLGQHLRVGDVAVGMMCHVDELLLAPGVYTVGLFCFAGGILADAVSSAMSIEVGPSDFYGSGKMPKRSVHGPILLHHGWESLVPRA